jgi:hypothetical protein
MPTVLFLKKAIMKNLLKGRYGDGGQIGFLISAVTISIIVATLSISTK